MLRLTKGQASQDIVVTLNEKRTLTAGYYLFVFTHILTKNVVTRIYSFLEDDSPYQDRYNQFAIETSLLFDTQPIGQWNYDAYEQASSTNTNPAGLNQVETGIMQLKPVSSFQFEKNNQSTSFKVYAG